MRGCSVKRGGPQHPKTMRLALQCKLPVYAAVGLLEMLFHFTAQYAPAGDIGKFTDEEIERAVGWDGEAGRFVDGLLTAQYVEHHDTHRLVVHQWHEHADQAVQRVLARRGENFVTNEKKKRKASSRRLASELAAASLARGNGNGLGNGSGVVVSGEEKEREKEEGFTAFYDAYPRKEKAADARKAWVAARRPDTPTVLAALAAQKAGNWRGRALKYIPLPGTWIRGEQWNDAITAGGDDGTATTVRTSGSEDAGKWEREAATRDARRVAIVARCVGDGTA